MGRDQFDNQIDGQMTIADLYEPPEKLFAVSRIFANARKSMSLAEQKTFVYALTHFKFKEQPDKNYVRLDKKTLANIIGIHSDPDHLSVDLFDAIREMTAHSHIEIREKDLDFYASGFVITSVISFKNFVRVRFNEDYLPLFTNLETNYITMWSTDIFGMNSKRSVQFYEFLRQNTDTRKRINSIGLGVKALKEMFDIPKEGKGSYVRDRDKGGFDRTNFEKRVIDPICEDLLKCKMINLIIQPGGKPYEKVKRGNRVDGYRFFWTFTNRPGIATAEETDEIQERVDKNPVIMKVAKDIVEGEKKGNAGKNNSFNNFPQREYTQEQLDQLSAIPENDQKQTGQDREDYERELLTNIMKKK